ncbi:helix-turn-helix domain-containing protein [Teredinibacter purpureus]|uniref:helix-turn-helix domain-containing protein n=1 Tax=Teredinibacter purpureus TaxID=2731756 RepID=UPI0005F7A9FE|nr:helix-turn-helix domain-containing protein [Teredinibacter purpureus]
MIDNQKSCTVADVNARHFLRCELVLAAIEMSEKPTLEHIVEKCHLPERTVHAIFKRLADQHRVSIVRVNGRRHGYYRIADWGNLDRLRVVDHITGLGQGTLGERVSTGVAPEIVFV